MSKIAIGLSGGVDSSVAASLLKSQGHQLIGVFMRFWHDVDTTSCFQCAENKCCNEESLRKIRRLCIKLDIPLVIYDFSQEFKKAVVDKFISYYAHGQTPNPCVWCNEEIKFKLFYKRAKSDYDIDYIATGHYASIQFINNHYYISQAVDSSKDQSYFLYRIPQDILPKIIFPLADYQKNQIKQMAVSEFPDFSFSTQKESQDLCFVSGDYQSFLSQRISTNFFRTGNIVNLQGDIVGRHQGLFNYTIGQRKGLTAGGGQVYYVKDIDTDHNQLIVAEKSEMLCDEVLITNIVSSPKLASATNLCSSDNNDQNMHAQIRYHSPLTSCCVVAEENDNHSTLIIKFAESQFAPAPGQHLVIYNKHLVIGGGEIKKTI